MHHTDLEDDPSMRDDSELIYRIPIKLEIINLGWQSKSLSPIIDII